MSASDPPYKLALVGGGIGGLCLAIGLAHHNVPFHLYEAAAAFSEIGAGVSFNAVAQHAMRLIDPRIAEGFHRQATYNATLTNHWFQYRYGQDRRNPSPDGQPRVAGDLFAELKGPEFGQCATHRAHFLDELIRLMPEEHVSFGHKVVRVDDRGDYVELHFENGVSTRASAVVGCDGIKSHVRDGLLGPEYRAQFTGKYAYRGLLDMDRSAALLGDTVARNSQMHIGYHGHVLTFPVEHGKTMNIVAFRTKDGPWTDERWVVPMDRTDMEADFADWGANVQKILSLMEKPDVWALFDHPPAPTFYKNRVVLMGDAAHASTPHQGSGAGFAIGDAYVLANVLGQVTTPAELPAAFAAFDAVRRPKGLQLVTTSRETGHFWDFEADGIGDDEARFDASLQSRLNWIVHEDLEAEAARVRQLFRESKG